MTSVFDLGLAVEELKRLLDVTKETYCFDVECWHTTIHEWNSLDSSSDHQQHLVRQPMMVPIHDMILLHVRTNGCRSSFDLFNKDCDQH